MLFSFADISKSNSKTDHILKLGEKRTLHCTIDGHPIIKHTWYKGKTKLSESKTLNVHLDKKEKFGNYSCVGKNKAGEEVLFFSLKEQRKLFMFLEISHEVRCLICFCLLSNG